MSSNTNTIQSDTVSPNRRRRKGFVAAAGLVAGGALLVSGLGLSGADWTASDSGEVTLETGNLTVALSDSTNEAGFDLNYANLAPGQTKSDSFKVTNTGSVPASTSFKFNLGQFNVGSLTAAEAAKLTVKVGDNAPVPVTQAINTEFDLGDLNPGSARNVPVQLTLDQSAGNAWQGVTGSGDGVVTLKQ